jgi:hypothetical protein
MRRLAWVLPALASALLALASTLVVAVPVAVADSSSCSDCIPRARGGEGTITVRHGVSDHVPGRGSATQGRGSGDHDYSYVNEYAAPTCLGSGLHDKGILCSFALTSCPALDQVRFWIWHQTVSVTVGDPDVTTVGEWQQLDGSFCLGPDDPGVPSVVQTLTAAQDAFQSRVHDLAASTTRTKPGPRTLVHYLTAFTAEHAAPFSFDVTVAGATVHLHAVPTGFHWLFGDGSTAQTSEPHVDHSYGDRGRKGIRVDVTWGGWFIVDGGSERYPIDPPAHSTGQPGVLLVVEARAENVG